MKKKKNEKGFVLVFVIAVVSALSIMTGAMFFYYDNDLKSVSRNSVMQQVNLAAETGLQEGQKWITDQLNSNSFTLVDIQKTLNVADSDNKCLNRHGFTNSSEDVYYAKRINANLGTDDPKFEDMSYEVFVQRHADVVRSIYFSAEGSKIILKKILLTQIDLLRLLKTLKIFQTINLQLKCGYKINSQDLLMTCMLLNGVELGI